MIMAEDIITTDAVPTVHTQKRSDAKMKKDLSYAVTNEFPNPTYETGWSPENDADRSVPVEDNTTNPELHYFQNTDERLTNPSYFDNDVSIGYNDNDDENHTLDTTDTKVDTGQPISTVLDNVEVHRSTDDSKCQNGMVASKSNINPTYQPNSGYATNIHGFNSCNSLYAKTTANTYRKTNNEDGKNVIPQEDIDAEIPEEIDIIDDDTNSDPCMPYAVAYECPRPLYRSEYRSTERNEDDVIPENDTNDIHENRHMPSTDPNSIRDALNRNPMYVPNVPQQECCQCTYRRIGVAVIITALLAALIIFGTWLYSNNNVWEAQKTMKAVDDTSNPDQPALVTPYTNGHPPENTTSTYGHPAMDTPYTTGRTTHIPGRLAGDTTYIPAQSASDTPYTNGHPSMDTPYTNSHPTVGTPYTNSHPAVDTPYTNGDPTVGTPYTNGHPTVGTPYTNGHPTVGTPYTNGHPAVDTPYSNGDPSVDTSYTNGDPATGTNDMPGPKRKWRADSRCGQRYPAYDGNPAACDPDGEAPCCSKYYWCGGTTGHYERLTNPSYFDNDVSIGYNDNDDENHTLNITDTKIDTGHPISTVLDNVEVHRNTDDSKCQNGMVASKSNINPTYQPNSGYATNIHGFNSCNSLYAKTTANTYRKTNNEDGKYVIPQEDIDAEIPEEIDIIDDDTNSDPCMPYAVAYESPKPLYRSEYRSTERNEDNVIPENDNNDIHENRHIPSPDVNSIRDALNRNPMYVPNVPQQARCRKTTYSTAQPASGTTYTNGHSTTGTTYTNGHPTVDITYTNGHPAENTTYTNGHPTATDTTYIPGCPKEGYSRFNGVCYKSFSERKTRAEASMTCAVDGGMLAMPKDSLTNTFLANLAKVAMGRWIGLTDADRDGQWVFEDGRILTSSDYSNWRPGEPTPDEDGGGCVGFWGKGSSWDEKACTYINGFICQLPEGCLKEGYSRFNGVCYKSFSERKTGAEASLTCAVDGGMLAMPKDSLTNTFLANLAEVVMGRWIGLTDADRDGQWGFEDGRILTSSDYSNWRPGEPTPDEDGGGCAGFWGKGSSWDEKACSYIKGFICQLHEGFDHTLLIHSTWKFRTWPLPLSQSESPITVFIST
uniref:C-type lectin domain-containing protein n=1 Tax=Branchiostoma floridae TaxID=7739 RepID=C3XQ04_BRAFL|eukprot:XP_002614016.1 hypothetical protein BRAFLDRAFT_67400 [Branchiostoma floridae]